MTYLKRLIEQLQELWEQTSSSGRIMFVAAAAVCLVLIAGVGYWSARPQYVPLVSNLEPAQTAEVVSKLESAGIRHRLNFSGSTVLVSKSQWNQARLLAGNVSLASDAPGLLDDSLLSDPRTNESRLLRRREQQLASTVMRISGVDSAVVHIGRPDPSPFVRDRKPTTASVVVGMRSGALLSKEQAASIVAIVAGSVEGLERDGVTVMDTNGRLVSSNSSVLDSQIASQYEYRRRLESDLSTKAELMLSQMLGRGRALVRVTAEVDFTQREFSETTPNPDSRVKKKERLLSEQETLTSPYPNGPAGTSSNLNDRSGLVQSSPVSRKMEDNESEYEIGTSTDTVKEAPGVIKRLTVAAMVDLASDQPEGSQPKPEKEKVEAIIKTAVGFSDSRGDEIEVLVTKLAGIENGLDREMLELQKWDFYKELVRNASLGLTALVSLLIAVLVLRRFRPLPTTDRGMVTHDRERIVSRLVSDAKSNPDMLAKVLSAWMNDSEPGNPRQQTSELDTSSASKPMAA